MPQIQNGILSADGVITQSVDDVEIVMELSIVAARNVETPPDRDIVVIQDSQTSNYISLEMPSYAKLDGMKADSAFAFKYYDNNGIPVNITGKVLRFADNTSINERVFHDNYVRFSQGNHNVRSAALALNNKLYPCLLQGPITEENPIIESAQFDQALFTTSDGSRYLLVTPHFFPDHAFNAESATEIIYPDGSRLPGIVSQFTPSANEWQNAEIKIGDKTVIAGMRSIADVSETVAAERPFQRSLVVEHDGHLYEIIATKNFGPVETGATITVHYTAASMNRETFNPVQFKATVRSVENLDATEYTVASPVHLILKDPAGNVLSEDSEIYQVWKDRIVKIANLKENAVLSADKIQDKTERIEKKLKDSASACEAAWSFSNREKNAITLELTVTLPPEKCRVILKPAEDLTPDWINTNLNREEVDALIHHLETLASERSPFTEKDTDRLIRDFKKWSRQSDSFEIANLEITTAADGSLLLFCTITPVATDISITVDGIRLNGSDFDTDNRIPEQYPERRQPKTAKLAFEMISEKFAAENKTLVVERDGNIVPYLPETEKSGDVWNFVATTEAGDHLAIKSAPAPQSVRCETVPTLDDGTEVKPAELILLQMFMDRESGKYTATSLNRGIKNLTQWYDERGYLLVGGKLEVKIVDGELVIGARAYRLAEKIRIITDPTDGLADKREKHMKFFEREFAFEAGKYFNVNDFTRAMAIATERFPYFIIPHHETNDASGMITLTLELVSDEGPALEEIFLEGGYGATGASLSAAQKSTTHTGFQTRGAISLYPQAEMAGASISLASPKDVYGNNSEFSAGGQYYLDYISSVGANYNYVVPIGESNFDLIAGLGVEALFSADGIEGTDALYFKPSMGIQYSDGRGLTARVTGGPRLNTDGVVYGGLEASVAKRFDLNDNGLYLEIYARSGALIGTVPLAATFHSVPISLHGAVLQTPLEVKLYAVTGAAIMQEIPGGFIDVGVGVKAGVIGATFTVGGGLRIRIKRVIPLTITIGPALVNGVPTPITISGG